MPSPTRIAGNDRYDTNIAVLKSFESSLDFNNIYVAIGGGSNGNEFADALTGAVLAAKTSSPLILSSESLPRQTSDYLKAKFFSSSKVIALGGQAVVSSAVLSEIIACKGKISVSEEYSTAGTYGPETTTETIKGNVAISAADVTLRNTIIEGDLLLARSIGDGNVKLNDVTVKGKTIINGGGPNSIVMYNFHGNTVIVDVPEGSSVRLVAQGNTGIANVSMESNGKLEESALTGNGFTNITIPMNAQVSLSGTFTQVNVQASGANVILTRGSISTMTITEAAVGAEINLATGTTVATLNANASANVTGQGQISKANVNANNVIITQTPTTIKVAVGITANVGGQPLTGTKTSSTGSGGGKDGASTNEGNSAAKRVADSITAITNPEKDSTSLTLPTVANGYTLSIKSSDKLGVIALDGKITPPVAEETVALVLTVIRTSDRSTADTASLNVIVPAKTAIVVPVTDLTVNPTTMTLAEGGATGTITPTIAPENASNKHVTWTSSNVAVAKVANGVVTPVAEGTVTITATSVSDVTKTATCGVTVNAVPKNTITFLVKDSIEHDPIAGAKVLIANQILITDQYGRATIDLLSGYYHYTASKEGFEDNTSSWGLSGNAEITLFLALNSPPTASAVEINGIPKVGQNLTGTYTYNDTENNEEGLSAYRWLASDSEEGQFTEIPGAVNKTLTLTQALEGKYIKFEVTPVALEGTSPGSAVISSGTGSVQPLEDIIMIKTVNQLKAINTGLDKHYKLANDIDLTNETIWHSVINRKFTGVFDGDNYQIIGLKIRNTDYYTKNNNVGLFTATSENAVIKNVLITAADVSGWSFDAVGTLVGYNQGTIINSHVTGNIEGNSGLGGLVGVNFGTISSCSAEVQVHGNGERIGGLVGGNAGIIQDSNAQGEVTGNLGIYNVGGLVGSNSNESTITNSFATGRVEGSSKVGGLVGYNNQGTIDASYATGDVYGASYVGGLVGYSFQGTVRNSEAKNHSIHDNRTGLNQPDGHFGRVVGYLENTPILEGNYAFDEMTYIHYELIPGTADQLEYKEVRDYFNTELTTSERNGANISTKNPIYIKETVSL